MNEQPTALWLADELEDACAPKFIVNEAAAELRRLYDRINTLEAALRQALEALELYQSKMSVQMFDDTAKALRERLAQPERIQLTVRDFVVTVGGIEDAVGTPTYWAEWPTTGNVLMDAYHAMQEKKQAARTTDRGPVAWLPPDPPPECKSEAEKTAFAFGWFKALEAQRATREEAIYETIIQWDEGGGKRSRRELARRILAIYTTPQPEQEPEGGGKLPPPLLEAALRQTLEALDQFIKKELTFGQRYTNEGQQLLYAHAALSERLAQPEQEPVAQEPVDKAGSPCSEFWDWLPKAYRDGDKGAYPKFTKYNMEVAYLAGSTTYKELLNKSEARLHEVAVHCERVERRLKEVNTAAMNLTHDLVCMDYDDDDRLNRDRVMGRIMQWRNEWDKAMFKDRNT